MAAALLTLIALAAPAPAEALPARRCGRACHRRVRVRRWQQTWQDAPPWMRRHLRSIAYCESRNDENAVSTAGYQGLLQWDRRTWRSVGGRGEPVDAGRFEQWHRGVLLYKRRGPQPWPVCRYA